MNAAVTRKLLLSSLVVVLLGNCRQSNETLPISVTLEPPQAVRVMGGALEGVVEALSQQIYTVAIEDPTKSAQLTFEKQFAVFPDGSSSMRLKHGSTFSIQGVSSGTDTLRVEYGEEVWKYEITIRKEAQAPVPGSGNPVLRPGQPVGVFQFVLPETSEGVSEAGLDVTARLGEAVVFQARGLKLDPTRDPSGNPRVVLDLRGVRVGQSHVTGDLKVNFSANGSSVGEFEPSISNVIHDPGVVAELPASGGNSIPTSNLGTTRERNYSSNLSSSITVPRPWIREEDDGDDPRDTPPPSIYGEEMGPGTLPAFFATCESPPVGEGEETPEESFIAADPVYVHNGEFVRSERDYFLDGRGPELKLVRTYRSRVRGQSVLGHGWTLSWDKAIVDLSALGGSGFVHKNGYGRNNTYGGNGSPRTLGLYSKVRPRPTGGRAIVGRDGQKVIFGPQGKLARIADRIGNGLAFSYNGRGQLISVEDAIGRRVRLAYNADGLLIRATDLAGREIHYHYYSSGEAGGSFRDLKAVTVTARSLPTYPRGMTTLYTYEYDSPDPTRVHNLVSVTRPDAVRQLAIDPLQQFSSTDVDNLRRQAEVLNRYDGTDRVVEQRYKKGTYFLEYHPNGRQTTLTDRAIETGQTIGQKTVFTYSGNLPEKLEQTSSLGQATFKIERSNPAFAESTAYVMPSGRRLEFTYDRANPEPARRGDMLEMEWVGANPGERVKSTQKLDAFGQVTEIVEPRGYAPGANPDQFRTTIEYDAQGNPIRTTFPAFSHYNAAGQVTSRSVALFREARYNVYGQVIWARDIDGVTKEYEYYPAGDSREGLLKSLLATSIDGTRTLSTEITLDALGRPVGVRELNGSITTAIYDAFDRVKETTDPIGARRRYAYDNQGRLTLIELENLQPTPSGYRPGSPRWFTLQRTYDIFGLQETVTRASSDPTGDRYTTRFEFDGAERLSTVRSNGGIVKKFEYGPRSLSSRTIIAWGTPDEASHLITYDIEGKVLSVRDGEGNTAVNEYDWLGRLSIVHDPTPIGGGTPASTRLAYDESSHVTRVWRVDRGGAVIRDIRRTYDEHGRIAIEEDALAGTRAVRTYDDAGRSTRTAVYAVAGPTLLRESRRGYSGSDFWHLAWAEDGERNRIEYRYDPAMRLSSLRNLGLNGQMPTITNYTYDVKDRVVGEMTQSVSGLHRRPYRISYDSRNLIVETREANGEVEQNAYNVLGQLTEITSFLNPATARKELFKYDDEARLEELVDGEGNRIVFEYNDRDDRTKTTVFDGAVPSVIHDTTYDRRGLPITVLDLRGTKVTNTFDEIGRLVDRAIRRGPGVEGATFERFKYDDMDQMLEASNDFSTVTQDFNSQGLVETETQTHRIGAQTTTRTIRRRFSLNGTASRLEYPGGRILEFKTDLLARQKEVTEGGRVLASFKYLAPQLQASRKNGNGTHTVYRYNGLAKLKAIEHRKGTTLQAATSYKYDLAGNVTEETDEVSRQRDIFVYDPLHRLVSAEIKRNLATGQTGKLMSFDYDFAGNRKRVKDGNQVTLYSTNGRNEYTSVGPLGQQESHTWGPDGNLTESAGRKFSYDYARTLIRAEAGSSVYEFTYDAMRRLIHKKATSGSLLPRQTHYYYDDERVIETQGAEAATYVYGQGLDEVVSYRRGGSDFYIHQKRLWNVSHVTDATGRVVESYSYEPYGERHIFDANGTPIPKSAVGNPLGFTGRWIEKELGLYYYRARWYDYTLGRFISPDPKGFVDGLNAYRYARNNPATYFDPLGTTAAKFLSGLKDGFKEKFLGGIIDTLKTIADIVLNAGDYVKTLKTMLKALTDADLRATVLDSIKEAVKSELADAWNTVEGAINALSSGAASYHAGVQLGKALGWLAGKLMRGGGSIAVFFARIGKKVKDILKKVRRKKRCPGNGKGCFLAGTMVETEEGPKPIEKIEVGDKVLSMNPQTGERSYQQVIRRIPGYTRLVCRVEVRNLSRAAHRGSRARHRVGHAAVRVSSEGESEEGEEPPPGAQVLFATPNHPFFVKGRGWCPAEDLKAGDELFSAGDQATVVHSVSVSSRQVLTYNLEVEGFHTYFVRARSDGPPVLVHNNQGCPKEGIYEFTDKDGKAYVGQSNNIPRRLKEHERSGKKPKANKAKTKEVLGGKTEREKAEHGRIQQITGGVKARKSDKVSNRVDPIGKKRRKEMGLPEPKDQ